jgi:transposase
VRCPPIPINHQSPFLEPRKTAEKALVIMIQEAWIGGASTRPVDEPVQAMGLSRYLQEPSLKPVQGGLSGISCAVGHDGSKGARPCRDPKSLVFLTPGQAGDCPVAAGLLGHLRQDTIVLADKAYDADWRHGQIKAAGATSRRWCIAAGSAASARRSIGRAIALEWFFNRIKHFRRLATRYEKYVSNFRAMLKLAAVRLWLCHNESVT